MIRRTRVWVACFFSLVTDAGWSQAGTIIAAVQLEEGPVSLAIAADGRTWRGSFGFLPGQWQSAMPIPAGKQIAAICRMSSSNVIMVATDGTTYQGNFGFLPGSWTERTAFPLPGELVALSGTGGGVIGLTGNGRAFYGAFGTTPGTWTEVAPVPLTGVATEAFSWSGVKQGFRPSR